MPEAIPFVDERDRHIERLLLHIHELGCVANCFQELYNSERRGIPMDLGNPRDLFDLIARVQETADELRKQGYGMQVNRATDA